MTVLNTLLSHIYEAQGECNRLLLNLEESNINDFAVEESLISAAKSLESIANELEGVEYEKDIKEEESYYNRSR
jgi:hypothetical protein